MGACGLHALVDPIARSMPFSMFGHKFGHKFGHNFGRIRKGMELLEPSNRAMVLLDARNGALGGHWIIKYIVFQGI